MHQAGVTSDAGLVLPPKKEEKLMKKAYETPALTRRGDFRTKTGLLAKNGNDRLIFSKN
ncbi:hypothetical protein GCM10010315_34390 [Streptomyces luteosporeus]|uniref:Lasso RiPP family leader peptide-containing protein n=1 Tax=Streptomyces luteosporeus TaxID=173856 RepID=A0ABP6G7M7_9ACTN